MNSEIIGIIVICAGLYYWSSAKRIHEIAYASAKNHCQKLQLQLLDDYVALHNLAIKRNKRGTYHLIRTYHFEFTSTGDERYQGTLIMHSDKIRDLILEPYRVDYNQ